MEEWKDIKEYEGLYQVSNLGKVRSLKVKGKTYSNKVLRQSKNKKGYMQVTLSKNAKSKRI